MSHYHLHEYSPAVVMWVTLEHAVRRGKLSINNNTKLCLQYEPVMHDALIDSGGFLFISCINVEHWSEAEIFFFVHEWLHHNLIHRRSSLGKSLLTVHFCIHAGWKSLLAITYFASGHTGIYVSGSAPITSEQLTYPSREVQLASGEFLGSD
ncbi:unnamed protein product [Aspergillus oryzae var. brunneus]|uniref:Unnamed protein product n=2 Tax=Aspergillus oryzae TaxID=5062 RepID=A0AAN4YUJ7_ASPOZ|nr:unnamed protein product [Aspergillus oryzae]GMG54266.1 unnamed protein product [Aspergillus oryzae var. brunneus]